jgi:hypothetical protein
MPIESHANFANPGGVKVRRWPCVFHFCPQGRHPELTGACLRFVPGLTTVTARLKVRTVR